MLIDVSLNDIYVNITDDFITMSNDDFNSLINNSRLHANINVNQNAESIINQAFVIGKFKYIYNTNIKKMNLLIF